MLRPERRTKGDLIAVAVIAVVLTAAGAALWYRSDARATASVTSAPIVQPTPPSGVPPAFTEAWRARSPATPQPAVVGPAVVTGSDRSVLGRDPRTGDVRWRYTRNIPLCTVGTEWGRALAVYRKATNCSEVTSLDGATGERGPQRNSDAEFGTQLLSDGTHVTTTGDIVESWRSDLVRTQQYGVPVHLKNADNNLSRPECRHTSVAVGDDRVGIIEECPREATDRITLIEANPEDYEEPEEVFSTLVSGTDANVVAVAEDRLAVVLRDQGRLVVYDEKGHLVSQAPVPVPGPDTGDGVEPSAPEPLWTVLLDPAHATDLPASAASLANALHRFDPSVTQQSILAEAGSGHPVRIAALGESDFKQVSQAVDGTPGVSFETVHYWYTGSATVALNSDNLSPIWTMQDTLGAGALFGGKLLVPVRDGLAVLDPASGTRERIIPVDRQGYSGPVRLDAVGDTLLEQRGETLVALR